MNNFMKIAIKEAQKSYHNNDVPVGAVIVKNNKVIAKGHNQKEQKKIVTKHAEIIAIEKACKKLKTWHLENCILYVTLEPCMMCCGAIIQSRIYKIIYATESEKFGFTENVEKILMNSKNNHQVKFEKGLFEKESQELLKSFFSKKRKYGEMQS
ncbi:MAG: nucleoside deaminase [Bacilli bacterium]